VTVPLTRRLALAAVSGALYCLGFAGFDIWPLSLVAFVPLFVALEDATPRQALQVGLVAGTVMNVCGFYWLLNMLKIFSGFPVPLCALFMVIICSYQGGRSALTCWLYARARERGHGAGDERYLVFSAAFIAGELLYPVLFPWNFAASAHTVPILTQTADLGGPVLVGLVLLSVNVLVTEFVLGRIQKRTPSRRVLVISSAVPLLAMLYGWYRLTSIDALVRESPKAMVGMVQGNMSLLAKRQDPAEGLRRHLDLTHQLRNEGADLVVWSETSAMSPAQEDRAFQVLRDRVGKQLGVPTIFGAVIYRHDGDLLKLFNVAVASTKEGDITSRYDKQYLLMFGEYLPLGDTFPILYKWSPHSGQFRPGTSLEPLTTKVRGVERRITTLICYEDILPGFTNDAVRHASPDLLVNITNDAWFGDTAEPWEHLALAKLRAIEHRRYLVRSTNSGVSAIIDPVGRTVVNTKTFEIATAKAEVAFLNHRTLYEIVGDKLWYLVALLSLGLAWVRRSPVAELRES
jgi:apolipoprotein N-acyltransferase